MPVQMKRVPIEVVPEIIQKIEKQPAMKVAIVEEYAKEFGVTVPAIHNKIRRYKESPKRNIDPSSNGLSSPEEGEGEETGESVFKRPARVKVNRPTVPPEERLRGKKGAGEITVSIKRGDLVIEATGAVRDIVTLISEL